MKPPRNSGVARASDPGPLTKCPKSEPPTVFLFIFLFFSTHLLSSFWTSRGHRCRPFFPPGSCLQFLSRIGFSNATARRFFIRVSLTHALVLSASQFVRKKKSPRTYTSVRSGGFELTKLTYTRLEDNRILHRGFQG